MAKKRTSALIVDKKESLPMRVNHNTREWEIFDPKTNSYKPTGLSAVPDDDSTAMKYYKLTNTPVAPTAPGDSQTSWATKAELNEAVITQGGWNADPLQVSLENRFCWAAYYKLENILDNATNTYNQKYTLNMIGLWNNYAPSPKISVSADGKVTIVNTDGTTETHQLMTASSYKTLFTMVKSVQEQMDDAVYSYSGAGVPTKDITKLPVNTWGLETTDAPNTVADVYNKHVGDTYTNTEDYVSYRFVLKEGASPSLPESYEWQIIADGALSAALHEIAKLGGQSVKIFTDQPTVPYKAGDMWIDGTIIKTCIAQKDENGTFAETDWIVPFATKEDLKIVADGLNKAQTDLDTTRGNVKDLQDALTTLETETLKAMEDGIISENERANLKTFSDQLDVEQEQLLSNVSYLKSSLYLPDKEKTALENAANKLLTATTGTLDVLQEKIADILNVSGDQGATISTAEKQAYESALAVYKIDHKALSQAVNNARAAIDEKIKSLADERVDNLQVGGRNLATMADMMQLGYSATTGEDEFGKYIEFNTLDSGSPKMPSIIFEENTQYTLSLKGRTISGSALWIIFFYTDETNTRSALINSELTEIKMTSDKGKTVDFISYTWASGGKRRIYNMKIEKGTVATDWSPAPEDIEAQIDAINSNPPRINPDTKNWEVYKFVDGVGQYVDTGDTSIGDDGKAPEIREGYWWIFNGTEYVNSGVKAVGADGEKGEDALSVTTQIQGHFRNYWERVVDSQGAESYILRKEVVGGVMVDGTEYVQVTAIIRKGVRDVTDSAIEKGAALDWYVNGVLKFQNIKTINLGVEFADGGDDNIILEYDDTNAAEW